MSQTFNDPPQDQTAQNRTKNSTWGWLLALVAVFALFFWIIPALRHNSESQQMGSVSKKDNAQQTADQPTAEFEEILISGDTDLGVNPQRLDGKPVMLRGEVLEILDPKFFIIQTDGVSPGHQVTVLMENSEALPVLKQSDRVSIHGTAKMASVAELEKKAGKEIAADLADTAEVRTDPMLVIYARKVANLSEEGIAH